MFARKLPCSLPDLREYARLAGSSGLAWVTSDLPSFLVETRSCREPGRFIPRLSSVLVLAEYTVAYNSRIPPLFFGFPCHVALKARDAEARFLSRVVLWLLRLRHHSALSYP